MTFAPASSFGNVYVPVYRNYDLEDDALKLSLARDYITLAYAVNARTNGIFETVETQNGEQFYSTTDNQAKKRYVFRKCFIIDSVTAGSTWSINHEITNLDGFTRVYGVATTDTPDYRALPYASVTANANIELTITPTQIVINNGSASPNITGGNVTLEYTKQ